jgi:hypothetical protein
VRHKLRRPANHSNQTRPDSAMRRMFGPAVEAGAAAYRRARDLPGLIALWPHELSDESPQRRRLVLAKLRRALRAERRRGIAGHWSYDLNRHLGLLSAYKGELAFLERGRPAAQPNCARRGKDFDCS